MKMNVLSLLRDIADAEDVLFDATIAARFPGCDRWNWFRAISAIAGDRCRRNDDQTQDAVLVADEKIMTQHEASVAARQKYYLARDGEKGFLGGRGL